MVQVPDDIVCQLMKGNLIRGIPLVWRCVIETREERENCCLSYDSIYLAVLDKRQFTSTNEHSYRTDSLSSDWLFVKMVCRRWDRSQSWSENDFDPCWIPEWAPWWSPTIIQSDRYSTSSDLFFKRKEGFSVKPMNRRSLASVLLMMLFHSSGHLFFCADYWIIYLFIDANAILKIVLSFAPMADSKHYAAQRKGTHDQGCPHSCESHLCLSVERMRKESHCRDSWYVD